MHRAKCDIISANSARREPEHGAEIFVGWGLFPAETRCARAAGVGLPERSEPEGPQGAARRREEFLNGKE